VICKSSWIFGTRTGCRRLTNGLVAAPGLCDQALAALHLQQATAAIIAAQAPTDGYRAVTRWSAHNLVLRNHLAFGASDFDPTLRRRAACQFQPTVGCPERSTLRGESR